MSLRRTPALLPAIAAAIAIALCSSGCGSSSATAVLDPVAQAADATSHAGGAHIALSVQLAGAGLPAAFTMTGQGYFNYRSQEGELSFDVGGLPASAAASLPSGPLHMEEIFKASAIYVGSPLFSGKLPGGAHWVKVDLGQVGQAVGFNLQQLAGGQSNPAQFLEFLRATGGTPTVVGQEVVRGVGTTRYHAAIDLSKVADALHASDKMRAALSKMIVQLGTSKIPVDVWVDSHQLVRRIALTFTIPTGGAQAQMGMTIELFGFGPTPPVSPPPAAEVFDATHTALSALSGSGG